MFDRCGGIFPVDRGCLRDVACDFLRVIFYLRIFTCHFFYVRILT